jgi:DNA-binding response OmpR family regulator
VVKRILVIDDEKSVCDAVAVLLKRDGYRVVPTECGHAGVRAIAAFAFDVVIVDIFMPGMGGLETIKIIRESAPDVPVIAMTGYGYGGEMTDVFEEAIALGATCCLHKPFTGAELTAAIRACRTATALVA